MPRLDANIKYAPPLRKIGVDSSGKAGKPIKLITNFFPIKIGDPDITLVHYDVTIKNHAGSEKIPKRIKKLIFQEWKKCFPLVLNRIELAFDGEKSAYSINTINGLVRAHFEVKLIENPEGQRGGVVPPARAMPPVAAPAVVAPVAAPAVAQAAPTGGKKGKKGKRGKGGAGATAPAAPAVPDEPVPLPSDRAAFSVAFKKVDSIHTSDLLRSLKQSTKPLPISYHTINILEVMFRHYRSEKFMQVGRNSYFSMENEFGNPWDLGAGKQGATGFFATVRPTVFNNGSLMINMDKSHCAFYKEQPVFDFIQDLYGRNRFDARNLLDFRNKTMVDKALKGLKVRVSHNGIKRSYRVNKVAPDGANKLTFDLEENGTKRKITIQKYFKEKYNVDLRYPAINCLHVGNPQKNVCVPMELCSIEKGQRVMKKLSDMETASFIKKTAVPPRERLQDIMNMAKKCNFAQDPILKALTFTIADMPLRTTGRVLPEPTLGMGGSQKMKPRQGVWDVRGSKFHDPKSLDNWAILSFDQHLKEGVVMAFVEEMSRKAGALGMRVTLPKEYVSILSANEGPILNTFKGIMTKHPDLQLIICIIYNRNIYPTIKKIGDRDCNMITQCLMSRTVQPRERGFDQSTINNILMKINAKLGGINNILILPSQTSTFYHATMVMGADVNHPPAGTSSSMPSFAAVVASKDGTASKYAVEVRAQQHRKEIILDMADMTKKLLMNFYAETRVKPSRIVMYRDGVSESQFAEVLTSEMIKIQEACNLLDKSGGYVPNITYLCVQKRHHTRLFCADEQRDGVGKSKNVPPGTTVDRDITHPTEIDFYLCSHQGIQGTSRPAHYHVLWDDSNFTLDQLQQMTYELCHVYSRCSRSVSIPTPAYYAHWAAFRSKTYASTITDDTMSIASGESESLPLNKDLVDLTMVTRDKTNFSKKQYYI